MDVDTEQQVPAGAKPNETGGDVDTHGPAAAAAPTAPAAAQKRTGPAPSTSFSTCLPPLSQETIEVVQKMGFDGMTPVQVGQPRRSRFSKSTPKVRPVVLSIFKLSRVYLWCLILGHVGNVARTIRSAHGISTLRPFFSSRLMPIQVQHTVVNISSVVVFVCMVSIVSCALEYCTSCTKLSIDEEVYFTQGQVKRETKA